jgi:hypothetical protein
MKLTISGAFLRLIEVGALVAIAVVLVLQFVERGRL